MKKFKIVLLILTILLFIIFLFATCRKTKALENSLLYNNYYSLNGSDTNSSMVIVYSNNNPVYNSSLFRIDYQNGYLIATTYRANNNYYIILNSSEVNATLNFSYSQSDLYYYVIIGGGEGTISGANDTLYFTFGKISYNDTTGFINTHYTYDLIQLGLNQTNMEMDYYDNHFQIAPIYFNPNYAYNYYGTINYYIYDTADYSMTMSEQVIDIYEDYILGNLIYDNINYYYDLAYVNGYQAGYDDGYSAGESAGYNDGYNAGYNAGYDIGWRDGESDGYDNGYDAGLSAGYDNGYDAGYDDAKDYWDPIYYQLGYEAGEVDGYNDGKQAGYTSGYNDGYADGQAGRTAVSPVFNIISGVFDVVASVLGIYLFPGITIGTFILVPLFFSIIGLVIWVWKKG